MTTKVSHDDDNCQHSSKPKKSISTNGNIEKWVLWLLIWAKEWLLFWKRKIYFDQIFEQHPFWMDKKMLWRTFWIMSQNRVMHSCSLIEQWEYSIWLHKRSEYLVFRAIIWTLSLTSGWNSVTWTIELLAMKQRSIVKLNW